MLRSSAVGSPPGKFQLPYGTFRLSNLYSGLRPGLSSIRLVQIRFSVGQLAHEAFIDLQRLRKTVQRRARVQPCRKQPVRLTALAAEVRFSRHMGRSHLSPQLRSPQTTAKTPQRLNRLRKNSPRLKGTAFRPYITAV